MKGDIYTAYVGEWSCACLTVGYWECGSNYFRYTMSLASWAGTTYHSGTPGFDSGA